MTSGQNEDSANEVARWTTGRLLSTAARRVERAWDAHLDTWRLNHASFPVLYLLSRADHSQRELADAVRVTEQTMSRMLARLERDGYVRRSACGDDRRRHIVTLLPAGAEALAAAYDPTLVEDLAVTGLTDAQVACLREALVCLLSHLPDADEAAVPISTAGRGPSRGAA